MNKKDTFIVAGLLLAVAAGVFLKQLISSIDSSEQAIQPSAAPVEPVNNDQEAKINKLFQPLRAPQSKPSTKPKPQDSGFVPPEVIHSNKKAKAGSEGSSNIIQAVKSKPKAAVKRGLLQGNQHKQIATHFIKVDFYGVALADSAFQWSCARDKKTGLLWETKLSNAGISDVEQTYSWYEPEAASKGVPNKGTCYQLSCDTAAYIAEMNRLNLCASSQWRLPGFAELETLLDRDYFNPVINQDIFFNTVGASYWTQTQLDNNPDMVMQIDFFNGTSSPAPKHFPLSVRLVSP